MPSTSPKNSKRSPMSGSRTKTSIDHIYCNSTLTLQDVKDITWLALRGKLNTPTEKVDGSNLYVTYDGHAVYVARRKQDIIDGGLDSSRINELYKDHPKVRDAFLHAMETVELAIKRLLPRFIGHLTEDVFANGDRWLSIEVVYPNLDHIIAYDKNCVIVHRTPTLFFYDGEVVVEDSNMSALNLLLNMLYDEEERSFDMFQVENGWFFSGPLIAELTDLGEELASSYTDGLDAAMRIVGATNDDTIKDFIIACATNTIKKTIVNDEAVARKVAERFAGFPGGPNVRALKKLFEEKGYDPNVIDELRANQNDVARMFRATLELFVHAVALEVLSHVKPSLKSNVDSVKRTLLKVIERLTAAPRGTIVALTRQLEKLGPIEGIVPLEGIVFFYNGHQYKLTGNFAPANQIMNIYRRAVREGYVQALA